MNIRRRGTKQGSAKPPSGEPAKPARPVVRGLALGLLVAAGLAAVAVGFRWFFAVYDGMGAYRTAPVCGTAAPTPHEDCVRGGTGRVEAGRVLSDEGNRTYLLTVSRAGAPTRELKVGEAFYEDVEVGSEVELTVWRGRVAEVAHHGHRARTLRTPVLTVIALSLLVGLGSALLVQRLVEQPVSVPASIALNGGWVALFVVMGGGVLLEAQWSFALTLGLAVPGWLAGAASTALIFPDWLERRSS
ncbi:hypothetical protein ACFVFS_04130 [Kitasatospora sp. NPDC057692]|uniref:hypothetical protein n=1 Tax=Kitasatospora sp. NPDC057692 TaxID=3346215 RepID=UPI0036C29CD5